MCWPTDEGMFIEMAEMYVVGCATCPSTTMLVASKDDVKFSTFIADVVFEYVFRLNCTITRIVSRHE